MPSTLTPYQLETTLKQQAPGPLYLVVGEEDLLRDHALAVLKAKALADGGDFNYDLFYGDEAAGGDIQNCALEMPAFSQRRLVVVKAAEKLSARETEVLSQYVKDPVESTTLVFMSAKLDGRLKFSQALVRAAVTIDCSPLRDAQLGPWLTREAEQVGLHLVSYVTPGLAVTAADVQALRGIEPGASVFDLTVAIAEGQQGKVLSILARNLEAGEAPLRILGSLAWQYRRIWKAKEAMATGSRDGELARTLRMDPMKVRPFLERFSDQHLQAAVRLFLEVDGQLKGGSSSRPKMVLERLLLSLCRHVDQKPTVQPPSRPPTPTGRRTTRVVSNVRTIRSGNRTKR